MNRIERITQMQAIQTRYFGPSNVRGSRIKATCAATSITVGYDHALNSEKNHEAAAIALIAKMGWQDVVDTLHGGQLKNGDYVLVMGGK